MLQKSSATVAPDHVVFDKRDEFSVFDWKCSATNC